MQYTIYKVTNIINGMCYVGMTTQTPERRWRRNKKRKGLLSKEIDLIGADKFSIETLCVTENKKDASDLENENILKFNCLAPNGYNSIVKINGKIIRYKNPCIDFGVYKEATHAAIARDLYALEKNENAILNFPNFKEEYKTWSLELFRKKYAKKTPYPRKGVESSV